MELLRSYQVLDRPGTFLVSVAYDVTHANLYTRDEWPRYLVPLRVITGSNLIQLMSILNEYKVVTFDVIKHLFMTGAIFDNGEVDTSLLPIKGEKILATFEEKDGKLLCTHLKLIDREELFYVDLAKVSDFYNHVKQFTTNV